MRSLLGKLLKYFLIPIMAIVLLWVGYFLIYANFHQVDKELYRSAQLRPFNMPYYVHKHHIKSIINFRGESSDSWYKDEVLFANENNLTYYNYGIGDRTEITIKQMDEMVNLMKKAPKPLLIHCKAGADRTSLASALYLYALKKDKDANREISILYGHFPWLGSKTYFMDESFENYKTKYPLTEYYE
jgi:protein tyrosine phosphatase (PTP) superfamily phosphohydrolase (DUF442 family)